MKVVILAGGFGTRISEESTVRPKPMVEIGGRPMLWHIMKQYSHFGLNDFIICLGYKGHQIKEYFANYILYSSDVRVHLRERRVELLSDRAEPWTVTLIDTGENCMTGGRLRRVRDLIGDETFCMTYGDGVSDLDIAAEIAFHRKHGKLATVAAVQPPGRFGAFLLDQDGSSISSFREKPTGDGAWVNGGFFVLEPPVLDRIADDKTVWELEPMQTLASEGNLQAYQHTGYWQSMDTLRDRMVLEELWQSGNPPWKLWDDPVL